MNNLRERYFDKNAIIITAVITAITAAGQYSWTALSSTAATVVVVAAMIGLVAVMPVASIPVTIIGYFVPTILYGDEAYTLLPPNGYYFFSLVVFGIFSTLTWNRRADSRNSALSLKILAPYLAFLLIVFVSEMLSEVPGPRFSYFLSFGLGLIGMFLIREQRDEDMVLMTLIASGAFLSVGPFSATPDFIMPAKGLQWDMIRITIHSS